MNDRFDESSIERVDGNGSRNIKRRGRGRKSRAPHLGGTTRRSGGTRVASSFG